MQNNPLPPMTQARRESLAVVMTAVSLHLKPYGTFGAFTYSELFGRAGGWEALNKRGSLHAIIEDLGNGFQFSLVRHSDGAIKDERWFPCES